MGDDNHVHPNAVIGGPPQDISFTGGESWVEIGHRNVFREGLGDRVIMANNTALGGHVEVGDRAFLGGGVVVHQFCRIGTLAMIAGSLRSGRT